MKALKSELAKKVLADPRARTQLRNNAIPTTTSDKRQASESLVHVVKDGHTTVYRTVVVPKAG